MTGNEVIEEIKRLPEIERAKVFEYARSHIDRRLSGAEINKLAKRMVETTDAAEAVRLEDEIVRGFYGGKPHA